MRVNQAGPVASQDVNAPVARHSEQPSGQRGLGRIKQMRLLPECQHDVLSQILGCALFHAKALQIGVDARREIIEQLDKSGPVALCGDARREKGISLPRCFLHANSHSCSQD